MTSAGTQHLKVFPHNLGPGTIWNFVNVEYLEVVSHILHWFPHVFAPRELGTSASNWVDIGSALCVLLSN